MQILERDTLLVRGEAITIQMLIFSSVAKDPSASGFYVYVYRLLFLLIEGQ